MKVVILAGGKGTRLSSESSVLPKPLVEIGGKPILWHIMKHYSHYGHNEFIICCGYRGYAIKEYFADYYLHNCDITFDFCDRGTMTTHASHTEPWKVTLIDTGLDTMTGGRIKRIRDYIKDEPFLLTYGDGVSDVDLHELVAFHRGHGKLATLTAVGVEQRFGVLDVDEAGGVHAFREKSSLDSNLINAGFMVLEAPVFDYIAGDHTIFEKEPLEKLTAAGQLSAFKHDGFWQCMDTPRDYERLQNLWQEQPPWRVWGA
ncbi:MAG: glucose-1-phosphate cytidylyltransferase [Oscillospiraceae bacterium]